jgi:hypothetical protein
MTHLGRILGWRRSKLALLAAGAQAVYAYDRLAGWRRMVSLRMPARRNALGSPAPAHATRELAPWAHRCGRAGGGMG